MLPYRLRAPIYGPKLKQEKEKENFQQRNLPYRDGGPLERAIKADLTLLFRAYADEFSDIIAESDRQRGTNDKQHFPEGEAFSAFKQVFRASKVSMLHRYSSISATTGFMPTRCDRNAYSQLLYAVCLSILRDAICDSEYTNKNSSRPSLLHASYAVFSLYALYETNCLPDAPTVRENSLRLLSMGLQSQENAKIVYRRAFRQRIRIDMEHFGYLLHLRDDARAVRAHCQNQLYARAKSCLETGSDNCRANDAAVWRCECAVATDVVCVLERLMSPSLSTNRLELCAYTGPCSLEGYAGNPCYQAKPPVSETRNGKCRHQQGPSLDGSIVQSSPIGTMTFSLQLQERLSTYLATREDIRLPAVTTKLSHQSKRLRECLLPLFSDDGDQSSVLVDPMMRLLCGSRNSWANTHQPPKRVKLRHRHVSFGTILVTGDAGSAVGEASHASSQGSIAEGRLEKEYSTSDEPLAAVDSQERYDLVLPSLLSPAQTASLQTAIQTLLDRDDSLLLPRTSTSGSTPVGRDDGTSNDIVSLLCDGGVSTEGSVFANAGQEALKALLLRIETNKGVTGSMRRTQLGPHSFLTAFEEKASLKTDLLVSDIYDTDLSGLSSDEEIDEVSVAASRVGQRALQTLISAAGRRRSRSKRILSNRKASALDCREKVTRTSSFEDQKNSGSYSQEQHSEEITEQGKSALEALLAAASRRIGEKSGATFGRNSRSTSKQLSGIGRGSSLKANEPQSAAAARSVNSDANEDCNGFSSKTSENGAEQGVCARRLAAKNLRNGKCSSTNFRQQTRSSLQNESWTTSDTVNTNKGPHRRFIGHYADTANDDSSSRSSSLEPFGDGAAAGRSAGTDCQRQTRSASQKESWTTSDTTNTKNGPLQTFIVCDNDSTFGESSSRSSTLEVSGDGTAAGRIALESLLATVERQKGKG